MVLGRNHASVDAEHMRCCHVGQTILGRNALRLSMISSKCGAAYISAMSCTVADLTKEQQRDL
jgi:hypothetical protein